jgi:integrase
MPETTIPARITPEHRALAAARFYALAEVPPELEWFTNIRNERTRAAYRLDIRDFMDCIGIEPPEDFRLVTRAHVIAWRDSFKARELSPATIRRKLSALSPLYQYLCEKNAVPLNPVKGVQRPKPNNNEGTTPALSDEQARALLKAPPERTQGIRDRAILSVLLFHGIRRAELCTRTVRDYQRRQGVMHFRMEGKGEKVRFCRWRRTRNGSFSAIWRPPGRGFGGAALSRGEQQYPEAGNTVQPHGGLSGDCEALRKSCRHHHRRARVLRAFPSGHSRDERARARGRYCQGAGVAGACERVDDAHL